MRTNILLCLCVMVVAVSCGQHEERSEKAEKPSEQVGAAKAKNGSKGARLWRFLKSYESGSNMPTLADLESKFGKPDFISKAGEVFMTMNAKSVMDKQAFYKEFHGKVRDGEYYHFGKAETASKEPVKLGQCEYFYNGDENRKIIIIFLVANKAVVGWQWFENVPPGQEIGLPK